MNGNEEKAAEKGERAVFIKRLKRRDPYVTCKSENSAQKVKKSLAGKGKTMYYIHRQLCLYICRDMVGKFLPRCRK